MFHFDTAGAHLFLPEIDMPHLRGLDGRMATLCIRAEAVRPTRDGPGVPATVAQVELSGPDVFVYARLDGGAELCGRADPADGFAPGERVRLALLGDRLTAFDPDNQLCLSKWE